MKKEKYGITGLKQVVDTIALGKKVLTGKMSWWQRIISRFGSIKKLYKNLDDIIKGRDAILREAKDLTLTEKIQLNTYACEKLGIEKKFEDAFNEIMTGIEHIMKGLELLK